MLKNLRSIGLWTVMSLLGLAPSACADEEDDTVPALNGSDRGVLGLKILFPPDSGAETFTYEIIRLGEVLLRGDAILQGQSQVGLKIPGLFTGDGYSIAIVAQGSGPKVCRGALENWEIRPGMVTTVEVGMFCLIE